MLRDDRMTMRKTPYRSDTTWLSNDDLVLLDVLFDGNVRTEHLRRKYFCDQWNLGYSHSLSDHQLSERIEFLRLKGVLRCGREGDRSVNQITELGGRLWSKERCPVWDRFCLERYSGVSLNREMVTVVALNEAIPYEFLRTFAVPPIRSKVVNISDVGILPWRSFGRLSVGVFVFEETVSRNIRTALDSSKFRVRSEHQRTWWRNVSELQKFVSNSGESV